MFDLNRGEWFVSLFILIAIVSAPVWPALGEWIARRLAKDGTHSRNRDRA
jgi:hypothetical protein